MLILPCFSMWQPWASLLFVEDVELRKVHETRGRPFPEKHCGHRLAVHAALFIPKRLPPGLHDLCVAAFGWDYRQALPRGAVIGTVRLVGSLPTEAALPHGRSDHIAGDWSGGRYAMKLEAPERLAPIPWKGRQGWFDVEVPA